MGTDDFSIPTLQALTRSIAGNGAHPKLITHVDVLCPGDRPQGRGHHYSSIPVKEFAVNQGLRTVEVPYGVRDLRQWDASVVFQGQPQYDIGVVVSFGYFLPSSLLDPLRLGAINVHPSLLPRYRGAAPIPRAILAGDSKTGVSIIDIDRTAFDVGKIYAQTEVEIEPNERCSVLRHRLAEVGAGMVLDVLSTYEERRITAQVQPKQGATKAPKIKMEEGAIQWQNPSACSAAQVMRMWRAFDESCGVYTWMQVQPTAAGGQAAAKEPVRVKLQEVAPADGPSDAALSSCSPGSVVWDKSGGQKRLLARCSDAWIQLITLQPEFKKPMTAQDVANGYKLKPGLAPLRLVPGPVAC